jgi:hypothetical protein
MVFSSSRSDDLSDFVVVRVEDFPNGNLLLFDLLAKVSDSSDS